MCKCLGVCVCEWLQTPNIRIPTTPGRFWVKSLPGRGGCLDTGGMKERGERRWWSGEERSQQGCRAGQGAPAGGCHAKGKARAGRPGRSGEADPKCANFSLSLDLRRGRRRERSRNTLAGRKRWLQRPRDSSAVTTNRAAGEMGGHSPCAQFTGAERQALPLRALAVLLLQGWPRPCRVEMTRSLFRSFPAPSRPTDWAPAF